MLLVAARQCRGQKRAALRAPMDMTNGGLDIVVHDFDDETGGAGSKSRRSCHSIPTLRSTGSATAAADLLMDEKHKAEKPRGYPNTDLYQLLASPLNSLMR
jgi:hypothetical protein